jgi:glyoxylase-like metal-dependent hydrolase (beta-lactamase superfamily II)
MNFKESLRFFYGFFMGTSVHYVKKAKRYLWASQFGPLENISLQVGGSHNCGVLVHDQDILLIDTNSRQGAEDLKNWLDQNHPGKRIRYIINTHMHADAAGGNALYPDVECIWQPQVPGAVPGERVRSVTTETKIKFGDEELSFVYVPAAASSGDLVVYLHRQNLVFLGELFFNHIHPILRGSETFDVARWIAVLGKLKEQWRPHFWVPAEGVPGRDPDLQDFINYLSDLRNDQIEFSECRAKYDWSEIPAYTSLEENFDLIRSNKQTHITMNLPDLPFT